MHRPPVQSGNPTEEEDYAPTDQAYRACPRIQHLGVGLAFAASGTFTRVIRLALSSLSYRYPYAKAAALESLTANFRTRFLAVLGPNGAGKSTLLRILSTEAAPTSGTFSIAGDSIDSPAAVAQLRRTSGWMPQSLGLLGGYTAEEFLHYAAWLRGVPAGSAKERVTEALAAVSLTDARRQRIATLSGGMRQRLGLAQAIVNRPVMLILDEPTVGLDPRQRAEFRDHLRSVSTASQVILSTHLVDDVAALADEVMVIDHGRIKFAGDVAALCGLDAGVRPTGPDIEAAYLALVPSEGR